MSEFIPTPSIPSKDASFISIPYPFVPRCALEAVIACGGGSKVEVVRYYVASLTLVLEYLHSMDVIFRGMDPETMPIDEHGALRLTDFRFAKHLDVNDSTPGRTYTVCGVAAYMAPEVAQSTPTGETAPDWFSPGSSSRTSYEERRRSACASRTRRTKRSARAISRTRSARAPIPERRRW